MAFKWKNENIGKVIFNDITVNLIYCNGELIWADMLPYENELFRFYLDKSSYTCAIGAKDIDNISGDLQIPSYCEVEEDGTLKKYIVTSILPEGFRKAKNLTSVTIPETVINIGYSSFRQCNNLSDVTLLGLNPELTAIGEYAFRHCKGLVQINLDKAKHLEYIGKNAFALCDSLLHVEIPDSVLEIDDDAFRWCSSLRTVKLCSGKDAKGNMKGIKRIGKRAFSWTWALIDIYIPPTIELIDFNAFNASSVNIYCNFSEEHGNFGTWWRFDINPIKFDIDTPFTYKLLDDGTYQLEGCLQSSLSGEVIIESTYNGKPVTVLNANSFSNIWHLRKITIPNTIKEIRGAFAGCTGLTEVVFEENSELKIIGASTFKNCSNLQEINLPNGLERIHTGAFWNCNRLKNIQIPETVTLIENNVFRDCDEITSMYIPESVEYLGAQICFRCDSLKYIICGRASMPESDFWLPDKWDPEFNKKNIFGDKFDVIWAEEDESVSANSLRVTSWNKKGTIQGFKGSIDFPPTSLIIPEETKKGYPIVNIANQAFKKSDLVTVTLSDNILSIGEEAFGYCENLLHIDLANVENIKHSAFIGCTELRGVIPSYELTTLGAYAFKDCSNLEDMDIPSAVQEIPSYAFAGCSNLSTVNIDEDIDSETGAPIGLKTISHYAFSGCTKLKDITLPGSLTAIHTSAFSDCSGLVSIEIPSNVTTVSDYAFHNCSGLQTLIFNENLTAINTRAFEGCSNLTSITIPASVISIGCGAFNGCTNLRSVTFAEDSKLETISAEAFTNCPNLTEITLPSKTKIYKNTFDDIDIVTNETKKTFWDIFTGTLTVAIRPIIPFFISAIGSRAFSNSRITALAIPNNVALIDREAFLNCSTLEEAYIPTGTRVIRSHAFKGCKNATIKCAARKKPITWSADWNPDNLPVEWGCLDNATSDSLFNYELTDGTYTLTSIKDKTKNGRIVIPGSFQGVPIRKIGSNAFSGSNINWIDILPGITTIEDRAFEGCKSLIDINFPETIDYIGVDAFHNCSALELIQLPENLKTLKWGAFRDCDLAKVIYIPASVKTIENGAFLGVNVDERIIYCEATRQPAGWASQWKAKSITDDLATMFGEYTVIYNAATVTDSSKFEFRTGADGNYYVRPVSSSVAKEMVVVNVPSSYNGTPVTGIGSFKACKNLVKMILPDSITMLRVEAFGGNEYNGSSGCKNLNEINLPNSLETISSAAFYDSGITKLVIPDTVKEGNSVNMFMNCSQLRHITLPDHWTMIGQNMFNGCTNLIDIILPDDCTYIGTGAFLNCTNLQTVHLTNKYWNAGNTYLDLSTKTAEETAALLKQYSDVDWYTVIPDASNLTCEINDLFIDFTITNPNPSPQVATITAVFIDDSDGYNKLVAKCSEIYTIGADQTISEALDIPLDPNYKYVIDYNYVTIMARFENGPQTIVTYLASGKEYEAALITEDTRMLISEDEKLLVVPGVNDFSTKIIDPVIAYNGYDDDITSHSFTITNHNEFDITCNWHGGDLGEGDTVLIGSNRSYNCIVSDSAEEINFEAQFVYNDITSNLISGSYSPPSEFKFKLTYLSEGISNVGVYTEVIGIDEIKSISISASGINYKIRAAVTNADYTLTQDELGLRYTLQVYNPRGHVRVALSALEMAVKPIIPPAVLT